MSGEFTVSKNPSYSKTNMVLHFNVYHDNHCLFTVPLIELYENENNLNAGRFVNYRSSPQEYKVLVDLKKTSGGEEFRYHNLKMIEWVAQQVEDTWSFTLEAESVHKINTLFSFNSAINAVIFKMVFN